MPQVFPGLGYLQFKYLNLRMAHAPLAMKTKGLLHIVVVLVALCEQNCLIEGLKYIVHS